MVLRAPGALVPRLHEEVAHQGQVEAAGPTLPAPNDLSGGPDMYYVRTLRGARIYKTPSFKSS